MQSYCVNDVNAVVEEEGKQLKEADAYDRTKNKMSWWKRLLHMIFEIGKAVALMTSRRFRKNSRKNWKRQMRMIELRTRWAMENVFSFASWDSLISTIYHVKCYTDILRKSGQFKMLIDWFELMIKCSVNLLRGKCIYSFLQTHTANDVR